MHKFKVNSDEYGLDYYFNGKKKNELLYEISLNPTKKSISGWGDYDVVFEEVISEEVYEAAKEKLEPLCDQVDVYFEEIEQEADFPDDSDLETQEK